MKLFLKVAFLLIIPALLLSSCIIESYTVDEQFPYIISDGNNVYGEEYTYSDTVRHLEIKISAAYTIDTTGRVYTNIFIFNENNKITFDTSSVKIHSGKFITRLAAYDNGNEGENMLWYVFSSYKAHEPKLLNRDELVFKVKIDGIVAGRKENLVKELTLMAL